jgi:hypothetical protein
MPSTLRENVDGDRRCGCLSCCWFRACFFGTQQVGGRKWWHARPFACLPAWPAACHPRQWQAAGVPCKRAAPKVPWPTCPEWPPPLPACAGQDLLRTISVHKNNPAIADETVNSLYAYIWCCVANVAVWINGTEVAHTTSNITTVTPYFYNALDAGSMANALSTDAWNVGACGDEGIYYM